MKESHPTPCFDELYDCAKRLGSVEVVLEVREPHNEPDELWLLLSRLDDGDVMHERQVTATVEAAAMSIRRAVERDAGAGPVS